VPAKEVKLPLLLSASSPFPSNDNFTTVSEEIIVKPEKGKQSTLLTVDIKPEKNPSQKAAQIVAVVIYEDGTYDFINFAINDEGQAIVPAKAGQKIQILQVKPDVELDDFILSPSTEPFVKYLVDAENGNTEEYGNYIPEPFGPISESWGDGFKLDLSNPYDPAYPKKLDQRNQLYITQSKGKTGFSWAVSALAAVETFLGKTTGQVVDLIGMANGFTGQSTTVYDPLKIGSGNFSMSIAYMSELGGGDKTGMKAAKMANVKNYDALAYNISRLKKSITDYGSVVSAISDSIKAYNPKTFAYYTSDGSVSPNNMVQIIGWDNEFAAANFKTKPSINGAWIARDSRGSSFGDSGYVYISYADMTLAQNLYVVTEASVPDETEKLYSNSSAPSGAVNFNSKVAWSANTFEVEIGRAHV
jgi:hypothetical protein